MNNDMLQEQLPFLSACRVHGIEYIGIIVVSGKNYTSMYTLTTIEDTLLKKQLIEAGTKWWWQSNRNIPIDVFMPEQMKRFENHKLRFITKDYEHLWGPSVLLSRLPTKRIKRCTTVLKIG